MQGKFRALAVAILVFGATVSPAVADKRLDHADLMKLRKIFDPVISADGAWVAYELRPDRGDGELIVQAVDGSARYTVERGRTAALARNSAWAAGLVHASLADTEKANSAGENEPHTDLALVRLADGELQSFADVERFAFSEDGRWLVRYHFAPADDADDEPEPCEPPAAQVVAEPIAEPSAAAPEIGEKSEEQGESQTATEEADDADKERLGTQLVLRDLASGREIEIPHVIAWEIDEPAAHLAYAVAAPQGEGNGLYVRVLADADAPVIAITEETRGRYTHLTWRRDASDLAFVAAVDDADGEPGDANVWIWPGVGSARQVASSTAIVASWRIPSVNEITWSRDGRRLFFGTKPRDDEDDDENEPDENAPDENDDEDDDDDEASFDAYDLEAILAKREVDVWHVDDPLIQPNQKQNWEEEKDRVFHSVVHLDSGRIVPLGDRQMRTILPADNPQAVLGLDDAPYLKFVTWEGWFADVYRVDIDSGERQLVTRRLPYSEFQESSLTLSPDGRWVVYYQQGHWHLFDGHSGETRRLTDKLEVPFADEDHDYPVAPPGYGVGEWLADSSAVLIYDKYDVWQFPTASGEPLRLTAGRERQTIFRPIDLDDEHDELEPGARLLLSGYHDRDKSWSFWQAKLGAGTPQPLLQEAKKFTFVARADDAERLLYTRESYREFPDLWTADLKLDGRRKLSAANPQIADYAWGHAELVEWLSADGEPLQGVVIKPGNYEPGKRYPVLVYYYRFFSQRLHEFNEPVINHRPSFPVYASDGYLVFLPDIRFEIGRPGLSAVRAVVPGVQKLVDLGLADPAAIGLHGHSWSGYQTAFVITQTDIFAAAVAGAPVSNMTSAYSGIRWGTGLARQFQYEQSQSRLGKSLWEARDLYIENSPVFYADRIDTPLLIQFGDEDEAVPWYQGIELYLALRRLGKDAVFLQYRGEPHHLKKYANKLDYSIKMKEYLDHYLKGAPAPLWLTEGVPYRGE